MQWWQNILPLQGAPSRDDLILEREVPLSRNGPDPEKADPVMLVRRRISRIFFLGKFFSYPVSMSLNTFSRIGIARAARIGLSYIKIRLLPIRKERSLEDFFINRFGKELYLTFFKDFTEKVWGVPCNSISPEWGSQRVKGVSVSKAILHAMKSVIAKDSSIAQRTAETSLIEQFMYPKFGPGQLWERVAEAVKAKGGQLYLRHQVIGVAYTNNKITMVRVRDEGTEKIISMRGDYFFTTMPVKDLIHAMGKNVPVDVRQVAEGLAYRDFITVGLLLEKLKIANETKIRTINNIVPDNWIYIQERNVKLGRLQIFNNWSPYMVSDGKTVWIGMEYYCNEGDELWNKSDDEFAQFAIDELAKIDVIHKEDVIDSVVVRMKKTYPGYFGAYDDFHVIRNFTDSFENLFLIGRNGMHRYNNMDHSMLTAMRAVGNIIEGITSKDNIWAVNAEEEYHEER